METFDHFGDRRHGWELPALSWNTVMKARARVEGSGEGVPTHVGDIKLHSLSRQILVWWMEARRDRLMPEAEDVHPRKLVELLPYIRLLQWNDEDDLIVRIFGSGLVAVSGLDMTGGSVFLMDDYPGRDNDKARLKLIHDHPCGLLLHREYIAADGTPCICEFVSLPIGAACDGLGRIIGTIIPCAQIAESKLKFTVTGEPVLRRAAFIDIGFGLPEEAQRLSV